MRSRADGIVRVVERVARALALALIALALWRTATWTPENVATVRVVSPVRNALGSITLRGANAVHLPLSRAPNVIERDWLVALRRVGTAVTWSDAGLAAPGAIAITSIADPTGSVAISVATAAGGDGSGTIGISDTLGLIDSVSPGALGARLIAPSVRGSVSARRGGTEIARAQPPPPRVLRPLLITGSAGWEAKFTIAALEERGWTVHSRIRVSPTAEVVQGRGTRIDTASYAAVIVLDSVNAPSAATLTAYVRQGGGLILGVAAARIAGLRAVAPAQPGAPVAGSLLRAASASGREGLPMTALAAPRADAVTIDRRDGQVIAAARREGAGRVAIVGETESWRWRMAGGPDGPAEHRRWWAGIVSAVAYAPAMGTASTDPESAPYAALVHALGPASRGAITIPPSPGSMLPAWLGATILGLLLLEWASRRLRGER